MLLENGEDVDQTDMVNVLYFPLIYEIVRDWSAKSNCYYGYSNSVQNNYDLPRVLSIGIIRFERKKEEFRSRYQVLVDDLTLMVALCYCHFGTLRVYNQTTIPGAISLLKKIVVLRRGPSKTQLILTFKVGKGKLTPWSIVWRVVQYSLPVHLSGATRLHDSYETWKNVYILGCMLGVVLLESL